MTYKLRRKGGYTLVEMIVAVTVGAIVMAAIFPSFLLLYRVETTWGSATHARASGLIAEDFLLRDARAYQLDPDRTGPNVLVLRAPGTGGEYSVTYSVNDSKLWRTVKDADEKVLSQSVVAHGIEALTASCLGNALSVSLVVDGGAGSQIQLNPELLVTPRNPSGCPAP
jgi:prepilin-type N-terminal cleavage/methylation domain-containing protein